MSFLWGQSSAHNTHPVMLPGLQPVCPPAQGICSFSLRSVSVPPPGLQATVLLLPLLLSVQEAAPSLCVVPQSLPLGGPVEGVIPSGVRGTPEGMGTCFLRPRKVPVDSGLKPFSVNWGKWLYLSSFIKCI